MVSTKEKKVPVPLEIALYARLKEQSDLEDTSMAHVIRRCCRESLDARAAEAAAAAKALARRIALARRKTQRQAATRGVQAKRRRALLAP